ncbi:Protein fmp52, mitochondrial [Tulasnella sp. 403]|nr:Protein fmp52, mitochondrial [Tulasnella sp. 403]
MSAGSESNALTALLLGGTGATGRIVLRELLASPRFNRVVEVGRRATPLEKLQNAPGKEKLVQKVVDFDKIEQEGLADVKADVIVITLGTNSRQKHFVALEGYVLSAAAAAKTNDKQQRMVYLSAESANPNSMFLYGRMKAQTEFGLARLGYSDFVVVHVALLTHREGEKSMSRIFWGAAFEMIPGVRDHACAHVQKVAKCIARAAETGSKELPKVARATVMSAPDVPPYHVISNKGINELSKAEAPSPRAIWHIVVLSCLATLLVTRGLVAYGITAAGSP